MAQSHLAGLDLLQERVPAADTSSASCIVPRTRRGAAGLRHSLSVHNIHERIGPPEAPTLFSRQSRAADVFSAASSYAYITRFVSLTILDTRSPILRGYHRVRSPDPLPRSISVGLASTHAKRFCKEAQLLPVSALTMVPHTTHTNKEIQYTPEPVRSRNR